MAKKKHNELIAGLFVLLCLAVVVGIILWLGAADYFKKTSQQAAFYVDESSGAIGLSVGNEVKLTDRTIGRISDIRLNALTHRTLYIVNIEDPQVKVYSNGSAQAVVDLLGQSKLVIMDRGGEAHSPADEEHPVAIQRGGMDKLMNNLAVASEDLKTAVTSIKNELDPAQKTAMLAKLHNVIDLVQQSAAGVATISRNLTADFDKTSADSLLARIHKSIDDVNAMTGQLKAETDPRNPVAMLAEAHKILRDIGAVTADARPKIDQTLTSVRNTAQSIEGYTRKDVGALLADLRKVNSKVLKIATDVADVSGQAKQFVTLNRDNMDQIVDNMVLVSENLKATAKEVRRNPWRLLYKPDEKQVHSQNIYDAARAFSTGAEQLDQAVTKLSALMKSSPDGVVAKDPQLDQIRKSVQATFENFAKAEQSLWKELGK